MACGTRRRAGLLLLLACAARAEDTPPRAESRPLPDPAQFAKQAFPLVGQYIFANYDEFASSKVSERICRRPYRCGAAPRVAV